MADINKNVVISFNTNADQIAESVDKVRVALEGNEDAINQLNGAEEVAIKLANDLQKAEAKLSEAIAKQNTELAKNGSIQKATSDNIKLLERDVANLNKGYNSQVGVMKQIATTNGVAVDSVKALDVGNQSLTSSVTKNGGAVALLNTATGGLFQVFKDAYEASALFTTAQKSATVATEAATVAEISSNTARQQGIIGKIKDTAASIASSVATKAMTIGSKIATAAQWAWNAAVIANPLVALVVAIVAAGAAIFALTKYFTDNNAANEASISANERATVALENRQKATEKLNDSMKVQNKYTYDMAKANGASTAELRKLALQQINAEIAVKQASAAIAQNTYQMEKNKLASLRMAGSSDDVIASQLKITNALGEEFNKQNRDIRESINQKRDIINKNNVEIAQEATNRRKEEFDRNKSQNEKIAANNKAAKEKKKASKKEEDVKAEEKEKERLKKIEELELKYSNDLITQQTTNDLAKIKLSKSRELAELELLSNGLENKEDIAKAKLALDLKYQQLELALFKEGKEKLDLIDEDYANKTLEVLAKTEQQKLDLRLVQLAKEEEDKLLEIEKITGDETEKAEARKAVEDYYASLRVVEGENQKQLDKDVADAKVKIGSDALGAISALTSLFAGKSEKEAKKAFELDKALRIGQTIMSSIQGVQNAFTSGSKINPAYGYASAAIAGVMGAVQVASIAKQKFKGSTTSPSTSGGSAGAAPNVSFVASSENQVASTINRNQQEQEPIKAYVVTSEVTTGQALDRNAIESSTLG